MLTEAQHQTTLAIQKQKQMLTELEKYAQEQDKALRAAGVARRNKAYKQLGNFFMRNYCSLTERAFKIWRRRLRDEKHKQEIMIRTIQHWRKAQFEVVKRALREFVTKDRQREANEEIKRKKIE